MGQQSGHSRRNRNYLVYLNATTNSRQFIPVQFVTHIKAIQQKTPNVKLFTLDYGAQDFRFYPGQWVDIHLTIDDETHNCGYSITSIPGSNHSIEVAVKLAPELKLTTYLHNSCKIGDEIFISRAKGEVYLTEHIAGPYVFIAGGVGITPLYSMIQHIQINKPHTPVTLIYSISTPEEFLFEKELRTLEKTNPDFRCLVTVSRTTHHHERFNGRINADMLRAVSPPASSSYYLCGPPQMVDNVVEILHKLRGELDIGEDHIHYDKWWS
ncbi:MAG: FAD-dependent oxidoreductase [Gammaproteobacteria bacterium]|nr:FAD-dependent oxidoreductase [Gammaproteobacteria bacterium]